MSSISSRICSTSARACSTSAAVSCAGQRRGLQQGEQACERRAELVRDGGREAGAQLLVGGELPGRGSGRAASRCRPSTSYGTRTGSCRPSPPSSSPAPVVPPRSRPGPARGGAARRRGRGSRRRGRGRISRLSSTSARARSAREAAAPLVILAASPRELLSRSGHLTTTSMAKVLIVEDDDVIAEGMAHHLTAAGFDPIWVENGTAGLARLRFERPDVCVVDLMLPGTDGWKLIETARSEGIGTPIVVVSRARHRARPRARARDRRRRLPRQAVLHEGARGAGGANARRGTRAEQEQRGERDRARGAADRPCRGAGVRPR